MIAWTTDEAASSKVNYGNAVPPTSTTGDSAFVFEHAVTITNLDESTLCYFAVESVDQTGNSATEDNGGLYYSFITHTFIEVISDDMEGGPEGGARRHRRCLGARHADCNGFIDDADQNGDGVFICFDGDDANLWMLGWRALAVRRWRPAINRVTGRPGYGALDRKGS